MSHDHHQDQATYYTEQLCTIGVCGMIGGVAVMMVQQKKLFFLADTFHPFVFWGGIALLVLVAVRALAVWQATGKLRAEVLDHGVAHNHSHDHSHEHKHEHTSEHDHSHDHSHHDHSHEHKHEHGEAPPRPAETHSHGEAPPCSAETHSHDACCGAMPHSHDHDHADHDHSWNPWRYAVLLLPIVLFFMRLPNKGFSTEYLLNRGLDAEGLVQDAAPNYSSDVGIALQEGNSSDDSPRVARVGKDTPAFKQGVLVGDSVTHITREVDGDGKPFDKPDVFVTKGNSVQAALEKLQGKPGTKVSLTLGREGVEKPINVILVRDEVIGLLWNELEIAAFSQEMRDDYAGRNGRIRGQFTPAAKDKFFTLVRFKMTCCAPDARKLNVWIEAPASLEKFKVGDWVEVEGQIRFDKRADRNEYVAVIKLASMDKVRKIPAEADFLQ